MNVLITGGAGFIGAHVSNELLARGHRIRALDSLDPQVHGPERKRPAYLSSEVELMVGDVRDPDAVQRALRDVDAVIHLAALVGVGQSMYEILRYTSVNTCGTANLLQSISENPVQTLVVASSMSVYGEGEYRDPAGEPRLGRERSLQQLQTGDWDVRDEEGQPLTPIATREDKRPSLASVYALSKYDQEQMCLIVGRSYNIRTVALRLFNTYGPFQALSNPYTGVLSNFASRVLNGRAPLVFEDGLQQRDFVSVYDVARAFRLALETESAFGCLNISSGTPLSVKEVAEETVRVLGSSCKPEITGRYRAGDIRHCFADVSRARQSLGWEPEVTLAEGLQDLEVWLRNQTASDRAVEARAELASRGLLV